MNLLDSNFDEDATELPPARSASETTDILFYIAKHKLITVFEKALHHTLSTRTNDSTDVDALDSKTKDIYFSSPRKSTPAINDRLGR